MIINNVMRNVLENSLTRLPNYAIKMDHVNSIVYFFKEKVVLENKPPHDLLMNLF